MTQAYGANAFLNSSVFPNQLFTAVAGQFDGHDAAFVNMTQLNQDRYLQRIMLTTTLTASDMLGSAYWDTAAPLPIQAPFYLFLGNTALSNMIDLTLIGSVNVSEYMNPIRIPANTEAWGVWNGVKAASASKCQLTMYCTSGPN
ncbi:hypothetical protein Toil_gp29 [Rhodococcus phage Toil]|uniref:Uncharacterized protein n=1 Tax=Rhodococcus phage Toil TaxID=1975614 RepID=A0A1W6DY79_9VIRU|nr:hypothetical protein KMD62_gp29 [Rhodococcus phage Toil]ARK07712.1 hypothetical protein Toil_gp29 [Rhodococcus phage Toil]